MPKEKQTEREGEGGGRGRGGEGFRRSAGEGEQEGGGGGLPEHGEEGGRGSADELRRREGLATARGSGSGVAWGRQRRLAEQQGRAGGGVGWRSDGGPAARRERES